MAQKLTWPAKDVNEVLDYSLNWATDVLEVGEVINTVTHSVRGPDAALVIDSEGATTTVSTVWLSGGTGGSSYEIDARITTDGGRTYERSVYLKVKSNLNV